MIKENKSNKDLSLVKLMVRMVPMVLKACPGYIIIFIIFGALNSILLGVNTLVTQNVFDSVAEVINNNGTIMKIVLMMILLGLILITIEIANGAFNFMGNNLFKRVRGHLGKEMNKKLGKIDPISFEDTSLLDDINKANEGMENSMFLVFILIMLLCIYIPYFAFMSVYLYRLKPSLSLSLLLIFIPVALTQIIRVKVFGQLADESAPIRREYEYYERCIVDREYYKETRLLGAFSFFNNLYSNSIKLLNGKVWRVERKVGLKELSMKCITLMGYMGVLYLLVTSLLDGSISIGAFGAVFSSIIMMFSLAEEIICRHIGDFTKSLETIRNFMRFLELPERHGEDIEFNGVLDISLKEVSFKYPNIDKVILDNISLNIKSGETIAIVGENGAGKTTLVKLMTGIYLPTNGEVCLDGVDTSKVSLKNLYKGISGVFQKYQRYKMTLEDNIAISELNINKLKGNVKKLDDAINKADLEVSDEKFPKGYDTMLSREFDGIDLSGGQWQRVAIARGFYRIHNMIVLDEPTAAIDPLEESKIYNKFSQMSKGKTAIIVTHRLGSAKIADRIVVMDRGKIVEVGTHDELIKSKGKYEEMYETQSKWYMDKNNNECLVK